MVRWRIRVAGIVQGVGFRPFVYALATRCHLAGFVANDSQGVTIEVEGTRQRVARFLTALEREAPPLALIEQVTSGEIQARGETTFVIAPSEMGQQRATLLSPDVATCEDCRRELYDPADRRFRYPFINCTNCGPRFTIIQDVPYDRASTTMASFGMCRDCAREYHDPADRRFHAQPVACPACGPRLTLFDTKGHALCKEPITEAVQLIRGGHIVAIKGLGGYHLAVDAANEAAVASLRARKHREEKPFAIMAQDVEAARRLVEVSAEEEALLASARRPIVLLQRLPDAPVASAVAPGNKSLGIMLPYTPLHHLLARDLDVPIVLTSGNMADEPIAYQDDDAFERLGGVADAFLTHNRAIHVRTDDSVVRSFHGTPMPIRRARGYAPQPIILPWAFSRPVLACGAELKNTFCLAKGHHAFLSHHIGDLENYEALRSFVEGISHFQRLFDVRPEIVAYDLHPEYLSTKWALEQEGVEVVAVQHHHAHVASCLADNGESGPVIGVAFDGLGYGTDGTMWGGEFLVADLRGFVRAGHLSVLPLPGGAAAVREPWRMAAVYLDAIFGDAMPPIAVRQRHERRWGLILQIARSGFRSPLTSSVGRLFDAVAAVLGVRDEVSYEGQAAIELEQLADETETVGYRASLYERAGGFEVRGADLVQAVVRDLLAEINPASIAARFHHGVAETILHGCRTVRQHSGLNTVALSGGVFQNMLLLSWAIDRLEAEGFRVLRHRQVPPNDGGISLGQAVIANHAITSPAPTGRGLR